MKINNLDSLNSDIYKKYIDLPNVYGGHFEISKFIGKFPFPVIIFRNRDYYKILIPRLFIFHRRLKIIMLSLFHK